MRRGWVLPLFFTLIAGCARPAAVATTPESAPVSTPAPAPGPVQTQTQAPAPALVQAEKPAASLKQPVAIRIMGVGLGAARSELARLGLPEPQKYAGGEVYAWSDFSVAFGGDDRVTELRVHSGRFADLGIAGMPSLQEAKAQFGEPSYARPGAYMQYQHPQEHVLVGLRFTSDKLDEVVIRRFAAGLESRSPADAWKYLPDAGYRWTYQSDKRKGAFSFDFVRTVYGWDFAPVDGQEQLELSADVNWILADPLQWVQPIVLGPGLKVGQIWSTGPKGYNGTWSSKVERTESVTVPAGTFKDALVVNVSAQYRENPATHYTYWFAPGTGLVKRIYEPGKEPGYKETWELVAGRKP
jgi:hypothetical protein